MILRITPQGAGSKEPRHRRLFVCFDERMVPDQIVKGEQEAQITVSEEQAEELARWLALKMFGVHIRKADDA